MKTFFGSFIFSFVNSIILSYSLFELHFINPLLKTIKPLLTNNKPKQIYQYDNMRLIIENTNLQKYRLIYAKCDDNARSVNYSFMLVKVIMPNNNDYTLSLKDYMLEGNIIAKPFIYLLLKEQHGISYASSYKLRVIDNKIKSFTLTQDDKILLNANNYELQ